VSAQAGTDRTHIQTKMRIMEDLLIVVSS
jgi:hypothetical protein